MNEELSLPEKTKPSGQWGAELQVQNITFNSNYNLFLNKTLELDWGIWEYVSVIVDRESYGVVWEGILFLL